MKKHKVILLTYNKEIIVEDGAKLLQAELEAGVHFHDLSEVQRHEVEEERPVALGGDARKLALAVGGHEVMDLLYVGRLSGESGSVIDDLAVDFPCT